MKRQWTYWCCCVGVLMLAACAKPITRAPKLDAREVAAEQAAQQQLTDSRVVVGKVPTISNTALYERLNRTAPAVQKAGIAVCQAIRGPRAKNCKFQFDVVKGNEVNAYADGERVHVTRSIVALTQTQEELAMILAHEYAHNILEHPQGTGANVAVGSILGAAIDIAAGSQGVETGGAFSDVGGSVALYRYSIPFEKEADYLGLYILARAGFDMERGMGIWRQLSLVDPEGIYSSATHPGNAERTVAMRKTIEEIRAKQAARTPLLPELRRE